MTLSRKLSALVALSNDRGASGPERSLAAYRAAELAERQGIDYLTIYPFGLPE